MVTEIAIFTALPGKEDELGQGMIRGLKAIRQHPECISVHTTRCVEQPSRYMLTVVWSSLEAHTVDFRNSSLFAQWHNNINGLFKDPVELFHYQAF